VGNILIMADWDSSDAYFGRLFAAQVAQSITAGKVSEEDLRKRLGV
jgi:hypothetical protein